jgi:hypothetical protein
MRDSQIAKSPAFQRKVGAPVALPAFVLINFKAASDSFKTPLPQPLDGFKLELADPKAYRPFRHGQNFITMGIRKMSWNEWIEMDSNFIPYHERKVSELEKDIKAHVDYVDNAVTRLACFEVLDELTQYLTHRYPEVFQLSSNIIRNTITNEEFPYPASKLINSRSPVSVG